MGAVEAGRGENSGEACWREVLGVGRGPSELLQFSRGELGMDHENFSRKLRGKKKEAALK